MALNSVSQATSKVSPVPLSLPPEVAVFFADNCRQSSGLLLHLHRQRIVADDNALSLGEFLSYSEAPISAWLRRYRMVTSSAPREFGLDRDVNGGHAAANNGDLLANRHFRQVIRLAKVAM